MAPGSLANQVYLGEGRDPTYLSPYLIPTGSRKLEAMYSGRRGRDLPGLGLRVLEFGVSALP